jgi:hypothetical protein
MSDILVFELSITRLCCVRLFLKSVFFLYQADAVRTCSKLRITMMYYFSLPKIKEKRKKEVSRGTTDGGSI